MLAVPLRQLSFLRYHTVVVEGLFDNRDKTIQFINFSNFEIMKKYLFIVAAATMFAACSSDDTLNEQVALDQANAGEVPVAFDSYVNRETRAGNTGAEDLNEIKKTNLGFGVFGYYTNADNYDQTFTPNFMYNQQVKWNGSAWTYSPLKYWPNEFGGGALSDDVDKVSFFAYAPFVTVNPASGKVNGTGATYGGDDGDVTKGIVGMKNNNTTGDPMVKYISTFYTNQQVDLIWGTSSTTSWNKKNTGSQTLTAGLPYLNMEHPSKTSTDWTNAQKISFDFKHALASLIIQVDTKENSTSPASPDTESKVFIRSVTFEGFDTKGALNLNNAVANTALWYNFSCSDELNNGSETTIKDGRKDGKEGLVAATKEYAAINPNLVQDAVWSSTKSGVTGSPQNLFCTSTHGVSGLTAPIYVIPNGDPLKVTIEYDVLTADANLAGKLNDGVTAGSVVKNVITRYITTDTKGSTSTGNITLSNGKVCQVNLHLGLNSVEFDASVTAWDEGPAYNGGADLPHNN